MRSFLQYGAGLEGLKGVPLISCHCLPGAVMVLEPDPLQSGSETSAVTGFSLAS